MRTIRFPADRSLGQVVVNRKGVGSDPQPAQGDIDVPDNAGVMLILDDEGCADPGPLRDLGPDDVHVLIAMGDFGDRGLAAIAGLASLSMVQAGGETTDEGLASLAGLAKLALLDVRVGRATAEGIAHVAALPALMQLTLRGPVAAAALSPLAALQQLAGLDLPDAGPETIEAARGALSTIPINGTWLSAKARAKLAANSAQDMA